MSFRSAFAPLRPVCSVGGFGGYLLHLFGQSCATRSRQLSRRESVRIVVLWVAKVVTTGEVRDALHQIAKRFDDGGGEPVYFGSHRRAQGVIVPVDVWEKGRRSGPRMNSISRVCL